MLYQELLDLTNGRVTYEQFEIVDYLYMMEKSMTKKQAAELWQRLFDNQIKEPRTAELRRIKEAIKNLRHEGKFAKEEERRIREKYGKMMEEEAHMLKREIDESSDNSLIDHLMRETEKRLENQCEREIYNWYQDAGQDIMIYIIYKNGSTCIATGDEIVSGEINPKLQNIAYASYQDGWDSFDTEVGDVSTGIYGRVSNEAYEITDKMLSIKDNYEMRIEIKYNTEFGRKKALEQSSKIVYNR